MTELTPQTLLELVRQQHLPIAVDSRKATEGGIFILLSTTERSSGFIADAAGRGARYFVTDGTASLPADVQFVTVANPRRYAAELCAACYDTASLPFPLVGVTGTNGKTTTTYLLEKLFQAAGLPAGVIGTIALRWPGHNSAATMTTPDAPELHDILAQMRNAGVKAAAMEVSSHALDQDRAAFVPFGGAVFTNLTQDHLDYHKTFENYFAAKARLFLEPHRPEMAMAVGTDGEWGRRLARMIVERQGSAPRLCTFGLTPFQLTPESRSRHLLGRVISNSTQGLHLEMTLISGSETPERWQLHTPLVGAFNAENLLAVQAIGIELGFAPASFACFEHFPGVPGRLERIANARGLDIFVDYAHTPDALENAICALRSAGFKRVICLFGCGGDRDAMKRPLMGEAVSKFADRVILTSDNPRHEDPLAIIDDVRPGLALAVNPVIEPDRKKAIAKAIALAQSGDALLIAGKGHENTQQIGDIKYPFSDQETIRELCSCH